MTPERWQKVEEIFHHALDLHSEERAAWLADACQGDPELQSEVASLLESDVAAGFVGSHVKAAVVALNEENAGESEGRRVGPYRLVREIGRGGMGAVYLAARDDQQYESEVAIKLVRPGLDTEFILKRFRRERQILARLQHPNIARLLDGGTTEDGVPYLVMEYIDGSWITRYAAEKKLNVLERLRLFLPVCAAVEHAHRTFIVHRDLKPGNILIDRSGVPKLLDFGISKLLHSEAAGVQDYSETRDVSLMTPDYASPEQIVGDPVTIRSDVYSLGAVLYELLSGARPHRIEKCTPLALERAICLDEILAPSVAAARADRDLSRRLEGDLDNIILRAMQKRPERRYASVEHFADDLKRYLEHRPVLARPDSVLYRAGKFVRRNRVAVAAAAVVAVSLLAGATVAVRQANIARERFDQVRRLANTFVYDVESAARDLPGSIRVRQLITKTALEYLDNLSRNSTRDWALKRELAEAYQRIGDVQGGHNTPNLGETAAALVSYRHAKVLLDEVLAHSPSDRKVLIEWLNAQSRIGTNQFYSGETRSGAATYREALNRAEKALAAAPGDEELEDQVASYSMDLARAVRDAGDVGSAIDFAKRGVEITRKHAQAHPDSKEAHRGLSNAQAALGAAYAEQGKRPEALEHFRAGVAELEELCRRYPLDNNFRHELMLAYSHVGDVLGGRGFDNQGDSAGALEAYEKMTAAARTLYQADSSDVRAAADYGICLVRLAALTPLERADEKLARLSEAEALLSRATAKKPVIALFGTHKAWGEEETGDTLRSRGDNAGAMRAYQASIATVEELLATDPSSASSQRRMVSSSRRLAEVQASTGRRDAALATLERILKLAQRVESTVPLTAVGSRVVVPRCWFAVGTVRELLGEREAARDGYRRSVEEYRRLESLPNFLDAYRKDLEASVQALAKLDSPRKEKRP
ncbi:MAG TPA: protein kinase [Bryobacteraceae bacterium]|nr:protein kinase [Bryobacteraceae bacterium]